MANAKIISRVDAEVSRVIEQTARELDAARHKAAHDIGFVAANLRHDINALAAAVNTLRADVDQLKQGGGTPKLSG